MIPPNDPVTECFSLEMVSARFWELWSQLIPQAVPSLPLAAEVSRRNHVGQMTGDA
jgi:hypothetical protein